MTFFDKKVHFIGIGGAGMSAAALVLAEQGARVTGTDPARSTVFETLQAAGVRVSDRQDGRDLPPDAELVVVSLAVPDDNAETLLAGRRGQRVVRYSQLLGMLMAEKRSICVAGAHGKTTTAAMTAAIFRAAGRDPSFIIGGNADALGGSAHAGAGSVFVAEACEFGRSFLDLTPSVAVVLNIDREHLDCYTNLADVTAAFRMFADRALPDGRVIAGADNEAAASLAAELGPRARTFGFAENAACRGQTLGAQHGAPRFEVTRDGMSLGVVSLAVPGEHNVLNALAATEVAVSEGVSFDAVQDALSQFAGVHRRMESVGQYRGALVIDDYAHHPTEIRAALRALRRLNPERLLWCVFQPHQYRRTRLLFDDFAICFGDADKVILAPVYAARDTDEDRESVSEADLAAAISAAGTDAVFMESFEDIVTSLTRDLSESHVLITMGAGDVWRIARTVTEQAP